MALRDVLAGEDADTRKAAEAASQGRSLTGYSGRHTESDRFADRDEVFGGAATAAPEAMMGERVQRPSPRLVTENGMLADLVGDDPIFQRAADDMVTIERQPFGMMEQELAVAKRPGYRRYWFNDKPGRVRRAQRAGYAHVIDPDTGSPMARVTDRVDGHGQSSYLMEIPIQWYQQDMARQADVLERRLGDIRKGAAEPENAEGRYIPQQGISIRRSGQAER
jgi:hypothetical protein